MISTAISLASLLGVSGLLAGFYKIVGAKVRAVSNENKAQSLGLQALLRNELYQLYRRCASQGFAELEDRENFENLYTQYHNLGANGVMDSYREKFMNLPTE